MKNIVGQIPGGKDFFPRDNIINRIYRRLDAGADIYLAAPRRTGKSAIMYFLGDNPRDNYDFIYMITAFVDNATTYFRMLVNSIHNLTKISEKSFKSITRILKRIDEIEVLGTKVSFDKKHLDKESRYFEEFKDIIKNLDTKGRKIVFMIDEFPQTVENISRKSGSEAAVKFLQFNRTIRQTTTGNVHFILTGSIGLPTLAEKLNAAIDINDLNIVEIPPLERQEAVKMVKRLLDYYRVPSKEYAIEYLLDKIKYFIPFHLQLAVQELIDDYENKEQPVDKEVVDRAFTRITHVRNNQYFEHYYSRLEKTFENNEYRFAIKILEHLTKTENAVLSQPAIKALAEECGVSRKYTYVLRVLEFDGYISVHDNGKGSCGFTSLLLGTWWKKNV
jgi:hypothetical protein